MQTIKKPSKQQLALLQELKEIANTATAMHERVERAAHYQPTAFTIGVTQSGRFWVEARNNPAKPAIREGEQTVEAEVIPMIITKEFILRLEEYYRRKKEQALIDYHSKRREIQSDGV